MGSNVEDAGLLVTRGDFPSLRTGLSCSGIWLAASRKRIETRSNTRVGILSASIFPVWLRTRFILTWHWPWLLLYRTNRFLASWNRHIKLHPSTFVDTLKRDLPLRTEITAWMQSRGTGLYSVAFKDNLGTVAKAIRSLDVETKVAHHIFMKNWKRGQRLALAVFLNRNAFDLYDRIGIEEVTINAGLEDGGYTWARRGWRPINQKEWEAVQGQAERRWHLVRERTKSTSRSYVEKLLRSDDIEDIGTLARLDEPVGTTPQGDPITLGRYILKEVRWMGVLHLKDKDQRAIFDRYVKRRLSLVK